MRCLLTVRLPRAALPRVLWLSVLVLALLADARPQSQSSSQAYVVYTTDGRRSLPYRRSNDTDFVPLEQIANLFNMSLAEDSLVGGLVLRGRGQTILLIPGQSFASVGPGRIVSLPAPLTRERNSWQVPVEFIRQVLGPALNIRVDLRRPGRVLLIGDVRLPQITGRFERLTAGARMVFEIQPATPHRVTRQGSRITVRFDAVAIDVQPILAIGKDFVASFRVDGTSIVLELGPSTINFRSNDLDATRLALDFIAPAPAPLPPPPAPAPATTPAPAAPATPTPARPTPQEPARPAIDTSPGTLRTVVLDPGHGGDDLGVTGPGGTLEKDLVLQFARRLKNAIESRIGVRVLLTRDTDEAVPLDRRASLANNNKADLLISLHANGSVRPTMAGAQVLSVRLDDYSTRAPTTATPDLPVPFLTGGPRTIEILPWDLAQIGFTRPSSVVATLLERQLERAGVPLFPRRGGQLPLRPLAGASMPAVLVELGFLSNPDEEKTLTTGERQQQTIEAIVNTLAEIRRGVPDQAPEAAAQ